MDAIVPVNMRPKVQIIGYVNEELNKYVLKTVYQEYPNAAPIVEHITYTSLNKLNEGMKKCVEYAQEQTYDYQVSLISPGTKINKRN